MGLAYVVLVVLTLALLLRAALRWAPLDGAWAGAAHRVVVRGCHADLYPADVQSADVQSADVQSADCSVLLSGRGGRYYGYADGVRYDLAYDSKTDTIRVTRDASVTTDTLYRIV